MTAVDAILWTGIGGLPFEDLARAREHVLALYPRFPFVPQLAEEGTSMLTDVLPDLPRSPTPGYGVKLEGIGAESAVEEAFTPTPEALAGTRCLRELDRFLADWPESSPQETLKFQLAGPVTLLQTVRDGGSNPLWVYDGLHEAVSRWCAALAAEAARRLLEVHEPVAVWLDEPVLGLPGIPEEEASALLGPALEAVRNLDVRTGLHCCSAPPLSLAQRLDVDDLAVDAVRHREELKAGAETVGRILGKGRRIVLGVLPVLPLEPDDPEGIVRELIDAWTPHVPREMLRRGLALAPACGTMLAPVEREEEIARALADAARILEEVLSGDDGAEDS